MFTFLVFHNSDSFEDELPSIVYTENAAAAVETYCFERLSGTVRKFVMQRNREGLCSQLVFSAERRLADRRAGRKIKFPPVKYIRERIVEFFAGRPELSEEFMEFWTCEDLPPKDISDELIRFVAFFIGKKEFSAVEVGELSLLGDATSNTKRFVVADYDVTQGVRPCVVNAHSAHEATDIYCTHHSARMPDRSDVDVLEFKDLTVLKSTAQSSR